MAESIGGGGEDAVRRADERAPTLSVVVITHNERERIDACLASVFEACESLGPVEVVLVDSRSTDGTVEQARDHPVTIRQLPEEPPVTPSAGRYVGTATTTGDLILFVDGDMILEEGWLEEACRRVHTDPDLAGVDGHLEEPGGEEPGGEEERPVDVLRGVALYERDALASVGGFDPHLRAMEDIDVSFRLDAAGYDLRRLPDVVASHPPRNPDGERRRRWNRGYYHGRGELFRKYLTRPGLFARLTYRTRLHFGIFAWASAGPLATITAGKRGFAAWAAATIAGIAVVARAQGTDWTADKLAAAGPVLAGTVLGFPVTWPSPDEYALEDVQTVQTDPQTAGTETVRVT